MFTRRCLLSGFLCAILLLTPATALAAGTPTPKPVPTARVAPSPTPLPPTATPLPSPTPAPAPPTPSQAAPAPAAAQPTAAPDVEGPSAAPDGSANTGATPSAPPAEPSPTPAPGEEAGALPDDFFTVWHGVVREGGAYIRSAPSGSAEIDAELDPGTPVRIVRWVGGSMLYPDVITWGEVDPDDGGGYIFGGALAGVLPPEAPPAPGNMQAYAGTWVDVNLTLNVVTAYEDGAPVKMMLTSPGRPGYQTDTGQFSVRSKLLSQTMTGPGYSVPGVPHVQYFFGGEALHGRYWTLPGVMGQTSADFDDDGQIAELDDPPYADAGGTNSGVAFGVPSSHGCLGIDLTSATWLYGITGYGTPVDVHY